MKILILYHSGVGNTKLVAEVLNNKLRELFETKIIAVEKLSNEFVVDNYDGYVIGFPTYHAHPSGSIIKFIDNADSLSKKKPAYIYTTCGWYSGNALRIFAKKCIRKNIIPTSNRSFRCTATDGVLLFPFINSLFTFEKNLVQKIEREAERIKKEFIRESYRPNLPRFKLYSILNFPNKKIGQLITLKIFLHKENCSRCGKCIKNCNMNAMKPNNANFPLFDKDNCEKCYRCIHHCPNKALSLFKRKVPEKQLSEGFFDLSRR
ncbi:MAG: 4Fe-4S ferredoxin [Clostridia bacterium]|jgi:flavodoxin/Pyruvate/2-oxoacid:ferredoxin oxidoreductase delta subunit|nr:4Fe-4S ferredoxin [Clostridia bacterium]